MVEHPPSDSGENGDTTGKPESGADKSITEKLRSFLNKWLNYWIVEKDILNVEPARRSEPSPPPSSPSSSEAKASPREDPLTRRKREQEEKEKKFAGIGGQPETSTVAAEYLNQAEFNDFKTPLFLKGAIGRRVTANYSFKAFLFGNELSVLLDTSLNRRFVIPKGAELQVLKNPNLGLSVPAKESARRGETSRGMVNVIVFSYKGQYFCTVNT